MFGRTDMVEYKVGEILTHLTGFPVIVVESEEQCKGCLFYRDFGLGCSFPDSNCFWWKRSDKKKIIYVKYEKDNV